MRRRSTFLKLVLAALRATSIAGPVVLVLWSALDADGVAEGLKRAVAMATVGWLLFMPAAMAVGILTMTLPALLLGSGLWGLGGVLPWLRHVWAWLLVGALFGAFASWRWQIPDAMFKGPKTPILTGVAACAVAGALSALLFRASMVQNRPARRRWYQRAPGPSGDAL